MNFKIYRPKQVIIVALLTSLFWFILNIGLLFTYQGSSVVTIRQGSSILGEHDSSQVAVNLPGNLNVKLTRGQSNDQSDNDNTTPSRQTETANKINNEKEQKENLEKKHLQITSAKIKYKAVRFLSDKFNFKKKNKLINENKNEPVDPQIEPTKPKEVFDFDKEEDKRDPNGPGEHGQAVVINANEKEEENKGFNKHAFNELASRKISLHRSIPDTREVG